VGLFSLDGFCPIIIKQKFQFKTGIQTHIINMTRSTMFHESFSSTSTSASFSSSQRSQGGVSRLLPHKRMETKIVRDSVTAAQNYYDMLRRDASFCKNDGVYDVDEYGPNHRMNQTIVPYFDRSEVDIGNVIRKGSFYKVVELRGLKLERSSLTLEKNNEETNSNGSLSWGNSNEVCGKSKRNEVAAKAADGKLVVKRIKKRLLWKRKEFAMALSSLMAEAKYLSCLDHPNILKLRGVTTNETIGLYETGRCDSYFLIQDRLTETLESRIRNIWKNKTPSLDLIQQKVTYALEAASALQYLHVRRIIFRNLSPQHLGFLPREKSTDESIVLFDFGLARELPPALGFGGGKELFNMTRIGEKTDRYGYIAPDVAAGAYNSKADVYSWALVVYEMLTGVVPFFEYSRSEHIKKVFQLKERPEVSSTLLPEVPESVSQLMAEAWEHDVFNRLTMEEVISKAEAILEQDFDPECIYT